VPCLKLLARGDELTLRIVLEQPPKGVDVRPRKGRCSAYETVHTQRSEGNELSFEFSMPVKTARKAAVPDVDEPFVQGPAGQRFVYNDIEHPPVRRPEARGRTAASAAPKVFNQIYENVLQPPTSSTEVPESQERH
jgi:uncharacterized protein DUF5990